MERIPCTGSTTRHMGHLMNRPRLVGVEANRKEISHVLQIWCGVLAPHAMVYMLSESS